jgi:SAM-dependent methyltransferase
MFEYAYATAKKIDAELSGLLLTDALRSLRQLGLDDFSELLASMPDPMLPNLSRVLPHMVSSEVQINWTGTHGLSLLKQTNNFARVAAYNFTRLTGRPLDGARILDFGCGYGRIARLMYYFTDPEHLIGVDPWDRSIELCHEAGFGDNFRQSDYLPRDLPVGDTRFDLIYAFSVFTHLSERATRQALDTLRGYVRDDGLLLITIRPVEYWSVGCPDNDAATALAAQHRQVGFAFQPHDREQVEGDITYGDTSMTAEWLAAEFPRWRLAGLDHSLDDPYQVYVLLQPR